MATLASYLTTGSFLISIFVGTIIGCCMWSEFWDYLNGYWQYIICYLIYYLIDLLFTRKYLLSKVFTLSNGSINPKHERWFRFFIVLSDFMYLPLAIMFGIFRIIFWCIFALFSYMRADLNMYPRGMEDWDYGHLTFISTVRLTIEREIEFVQKHGLIEQDLYDYQSRYLTRDGGVSNRKNGKSPRQLQNSSKNSGNKASDKYVGLADDEPAAGPQIINLEQMIINKKENKNSSMMKKGSLFSGLFPNRSSSSSNKQEIRNQTRVPLSKDFSMSHLDGTSPLSSSGGGRDNGNMINENGINGNGNANNGSNENLL